MLYPAANSVWLGLSGVDQGLRFSGVSFGSVRICSGYLEFPRGLNSKNEEQAYNTK